MSRQIQNVASVRFEINARPASASMQALEAEAKNLRDRMDDVNKQIVALGNVEPDDQRLIGFRKELKGLKSDLDDVNKTIKDYTRGVKAADELLKAAETGTIEKLSMKAIKSGANGLKKRIENIQPDTLSPEDQQAYRIIKQVIDEADNVVNKFKTDAQQAIQILRDGGNVSERAMRQARDGVKSLMESYEEGTKEHREFAEQYEFLAAKVQEFAEAQRRAAGEIVNADDARRAAVRLTKEGAEAARQEAEMQDAVIAGTKQQISDYQTLRQQQQQNIDQTQQQIKANQQEEDSIRAKIRTAEEESFYIDKNGELIRNDIHGRVNALEKEKDATRQTAEQQQAAAQVAQNAANQKREAFEQTTQAVDQLDAEVKQLKADLEQMNQPQAPKENPVLEGVKQGAEEAKASLEEVQRVMKYVANGGGHLEGKGLTATADKMMGQMSDMSVAERRAALRLGGFSGWVDREEQAGGYMGAHRQVKKFDDLVMDYFANLKWENGGWSFDEDNPMSFVNAKGDLFDVSYLRELTEKEQKKVAEMSSKQLQNFIMKLFKEQYGEVKAAFGGGLNDQYWVAQKGGMEALKKVADVEEWKNGQPVGVKETQEEVAARQQLTEATKALINENRQLNDTKKEGAEVTKTELQLIEEERQKLKEEGYAIEERRDQIAQNRKDRLEAYEKEKKRLIENPGELTPVEQAMFEAEDARAKFGASLKRKKTEWKGNLDAIEDRFGFAHSMFGNRTAYMNGADTDELNAYKNKLYDNIQKGNFLEVERELEKIKSLIDQIKEASKDNEVEGNPNPQLDSLKKLKAEYEKVLKMAEEVRQREEDATFDWFDQREESEAYKKLQALKETPDSERQELGQMEDRELEIRQRFRELRDQESEAIQRETEAKKEAARATEESNKADEEKAKKQELLSQKEDELVKKKTLHTQQEKEYQQAQAEADSKQQQANDTQAKAISLQEQHTQATNEANAADKEREQRLGELDQKANKLSADNEQLTATLQQQQQQQQATDKAIADGNQTILDAEKKKAQARELSAKDMRDAIAALRERNDAIGEANPEWEKNERLIAQYNQRLEEMKQRSAELRGEVMSLSDALGMAGTIDGGGASVEKMEQAIKTLTEAKRKATDQKDFDEYGAAIDKISQKLKEATSEWMSLSRAEEIARQAGENYYLSEGKSGFIASPEEIQKATAALNRQREAVIKTIQAKKANKEATDAEEKELADLTKKLRDLKFEQDNVNMSQEKMRMLMKQPAQAVSLDELRAAIKRADGELRRMEGSLDKNSKEYKAFAEQVKAAKNTLKDMEGAAKASASAWEKAVSRLKTYVGLYMGFNIFWQKVTGTAGDLLTLSDKMGEVRKTTQMTADQVGRLSDALTKLDTRTSLTGLMEFSSLAGSIGLKTQEDVQGFTEAANMLSVSLPELGNEASRTLMKIADATGDLEKNGNNVRETLERVGSTVIALRANSAAAAGPITDFVSRVGAVGAQAGISIDQIAALGATVDALGGRVEMSATALSRMIPAIRNNTFEVAQAIGMTEKQLKSMSGIDQMVAVFKALHDSVKNFDMTTEEGMNAAADAVEGMLGRSTSMQEVMKQLNQQGARAGIVFGLLSQNVDTLEKQLGIAGEAYKQNTALMDEYNKMNDTAAAKWERLKNQMEEMFVSDKMQRILGDLIDIVRKFADWFGSDGPLATGFKMMIAYAMAMKVEFGAAFMGIGGGLKAVGAAFGSFVNVLATGATAAVGNLAGMTKGLRGLRMATIGARREWLKMDAAMKANIIGAVITAIGLLVYKLYDMHRASKEAAAEVGRFNQKMADERKALNSLFDPLNKSNLAQDQRLKLINEINSKYSKYLGYMLSETSTAIQLADAHALIAKRIKEEAFQRRLAEKERKIQEEHDEDLSAAYGGIESAVRSGAKGNADITAMADMLKSFADKNLNNVEIKWSGGYRILQGFTKDLNGMLERMAADGKLRHDDIREVEKAVYDYASEAKKQHDDIMSQTSNLRSDLRGIQGAIKYDLANNLNTLISNVANSVSNAVNNANKPQPQQEVPLMLQGTQGGGVKLPSLFDGQQGGWQAPWSPQQRETTPDQQMAPKGWKSGINKKDINQVRRVVESQEAIRSMLQTSGEQLSEAQRKVAESWKLTDEELKEYKKIVEKADRGPGGSNHNPYGDYNKVTSPYKDWNGNDLVARRKEMLERVKALANGADVQAVLSEDAKFISDAVRKNIKTTEQAIEWYNTERLKIQDALKAKHLTPTGDWDNPNSRSAKQAARMVKDDMKYYLDELDAYYTERKAKIEEERNNEEITEGEAWRRNLQNENEWQQRRAELQLLYTKKSEKVTEESRQRIFDIISERTGETTKFIVANIAQTNRFIERVGEKSVAAMRRIYGDNELDAEKSFLKAQQAIGKQMKFIEETLAKERPYDGITKNLQDNLDKMGVLAAKYRRENEELARQGKEPKYSNEQITAQSFDEMAFYLRQAADAYSIDIDELLRRMVKEGMTATAEEISKSDMLKQAVMGQLRKTYQEVQDAVKKEASQIKKDVEIIWNDDARGIGGMSMKATFDKALAQLGMQQDSVSRANSLIGAGAASDNVASRLAMKQIEVQMRMQKAQYDMYRVQANQRMAALKAEAEEHRRLAKQMEKENHLAESKRELLMATNAERDAENVRLSLGLTLAEETKKEEQQKAELLKIQEESQNRLYTSLREWADLLTSSIQGVMEASNAGNAEYYNERAKLDLTGKGGPGAGTYIVIDDAGTSDAKAHYEYLDERQALERQHEIEQQNAQAEAWKKVMDDINMKMSDQITDWLNASLQDAATRDNTDALIENTRAIYESMGVETPSGEAKPGQPDVIAVQPQPDKPSAPVEPIVISGGSEPVVTQPSTDPENTAATNANTAALNTLTQVISGQPAAGATDMGAAAGGGTTATAEGDVELQKPFFQMTEEETALAMERIQQLWQAYNEGGVEALQEMAATLAAQEGIVLPPWQITEEQLAVAMERMQALWQAYAEQGIEAMQMMSDAMEEMPNDIPNPMQVTEEQVETSNENMQTAYQGLMDLSGIATEKVIGDQSKRQKGETETNKKMQASGQSLYAKLTQAANLYGIAYQTMSNDNLSAAQKFEMIGLQAAGNAAIAALTAANTENTGKTMSLFPLIFGKCVEINPIAGAAIFAVLTAVIGGLMGMAASKVAKSKQEIAQVTGSSASAGRLATGMLTYAEGNVNEFTDPASLTPGRQYNVDGADGRTYRARYMGKDAKTHITNGPEFHLVGEKGREAIIDAHTTRLMQTDDTGIWQAIQTLYNGGRVSGFSTRRGSGVRAFAEGNINDFEDISGSGMEGAEGFDDLTAMQDSLDRNTAVQEALLERLNQPIVAQNVWTGPEGIPNMVNKYQKEAKRHGVKYL